MENFDAIVTCTSLKAWKFSSWSTKVMPISYVNTGHRWINNISSNCVELPALNLTTYVIKLYRNYMKQNSLPA
jgi:hypothetical protein